MIYSDSPYISNNRWLNLLKSNDLDNEESKFDILCNLFESHNIMIAKEFESILNEMEQKINIDHSWLIEEIKWRIHENFESESESSSDEVSVEENKSPSKMKRISKECVTFNPKTQYHKIENRKATYFVPSLKTHKIVIKQEYKMLALQALIFGDKLPINYDKVNQAWLKDNEKNILSEIPEDFSLELENYELNSSEIKKISNIRKRDKKNFLKRIEDQNDRLYIKIYKVFDKNIEKNENNMIKTKAIDGHKW